jgi:hypothetical protein
VRDPIGFYRGLDARRVGGRGRSAHPAPRAQNRLRRAVATTVLSPDPGVFWARRARATRGAARECGRSLGPQHESPRVRPRGGLDDREPGGGRARRRPAGRLARRAAEAGARAYPFRRWHEGRWERRVVRDAACVLVTSPVWRDSWWIATPRGGQDPGAHERLPGGGGRERAGAGLRRVRRRCGIGRTGAAARRPVHRLAGDAARRAPARPTAPWDRSHRIGAGHVRLLGSLTAADVAAVDGLARRMPPPAGTSGSRGGSRERRRSPPPTRRPAAPSLRDAPTVPSKLFEYLPTRRPILAVTPRGSAVWQLSKASTTSSGPIRTRQTRST